MRQRGFWMLALLFAALWGLLTAGATGSWIIGAPVILLAAWFARSPGEREGATLSVRGVAAFLPFFIWESVRGGVDVARRVLAPSPRLATGFQDYRMTLSNPRAQLLFVNTVSLLPGTLATDLHGDRVRIHALDVSTDIRTDLSRLEAAVARMYLQEGGV